MPKTGNVRRQLSPSGLSAPFSASVRAYTSPWTPVSGRFGPGRRLPHAARHIDARIQSSHGAAGRKDPHLELVQRIAQLETREIRRAVQVVNCQPRRDPVDARRDIRDIGRRIDDQKRPTLLAVGHRGTEDRVRLDILGIQLRRITWQRPRRIGQAQNVEQVDLLESVDPGEGAFAADEIRRLRKDRSVVSSDGLGAFSLVVPRPSQ